LRDLLPTITTPTQILAGRNDDLVPWSNNQYLDDLLPNSEIHPLEAGHFAWEQAAEEYGSLVVDWAWAVPTRRGLTAAMSRTIIGLRRKPRAAGSEARYRFSRPRRVWGRRTHDEPLFEALTLGVFEVGLSWSIVFGKREAFRRHSGASTSPRSRR
jgi:hypothetical protein